MPTRQAFASGRGWPERNSEDEEYMERAFSKWQMNAIFVSGHGNLEEK
jgi:hypothetical protein